MMNGKTFFIGAFLAMAFCLATLGTSAYALEQHKNIQGLFNTTRDVVVKCLECHGQIASEVLQSTHWTWERSRMVNGRQLMSGKKDSLAAFAVDVSSNPTRCLRCHISSAPAAGIFAQGTEADVDCLVCHDTTGRYVRNTEQGGLEQADFEKIARNVGRPAPENCATCHFADCGLTEYSRPDALENRKKHLARGDVHMSGEAASLSCQACHIGNSGHTFSRATAYGPAAGFAGRGCTACHTDSPHPADSLNRHTATVSCQTCHIPLYAEEIPAVLAWNWLLTGKINPVFQSVSGRETFLRDRSGFTSSKMILPVYSWDNGGDQMYTRGQRIVPRELTWLQKPSERSPQSRIAPFSIRYGTQLYDAKYRYLVSPLLSSSGPELFPGSDWDTIAREGMKAIVLPYSGEYGVAPTAALRRLNHGVAPAREALDCMDCHGNSGRMDWPALGYGKDPWSGEQAGNAEAEPLQESSAIEEREPLPPVEENTTVENGEPLPPVPELKITPLD